MGDRVTKLETIAGMMPVARVEEIENVVEV
jgi:hypothetical protein